MSNDVVPGHGNFIIVNASPYDWLSTPNDNLWQGVSGVNNPCPPGFRLPTNEEWEAEIATWSSNDCDEAYASPLRLPSSGLRNFENAYVTSFGINGFYWTSDVTGVQSSFVQVSNTAAGFKSAYRAYALSVRCIKN